MNYHKKFIQIFIIAYLMEPILVACCSGMSQINVKGPILLKSHFAQQYYWSI